MANQPNGSRHAYAAAFRQGLFDGIFSKSATLSEADLAAILSQLGGGAATAPSLSDASTAVDLPANDGEVPAASTDGTNSKYYLGDQSDTPDEAATAGANVDPTLLANIDAGNRTSLLPNRNPSQLN